MQTMRDSGQLARRSSVPPAETLHARIRAAIEATPAATQRTSRRSIAALVIIPLLTAIIVLVASEIVYERQGVGLEIGVESSARSLVVLCAIVALTVASTAMALWRARDGFGARAAGLALAAALAAPIYAALVLANPVHTQDAGLPWVQISPYGGRCLIISALVGAAALASFALALRRAVPAASRLRGAVLGAAAGAWAGLAVFIFCPSGDQQHLLLGHVSPFVAFTLLGGLALARLLRP